MGPILEHQIVNVRSCYEMLVTLFIICVNFLKKNEITIPSLQYRKAKELTVRLYGFGENAFT